MQHWTGFPPAPHTPAVFLSWDAGANRSQYVVDHRGGRAGRSGDLFRHSNFDLASRPGHEAVSLVQ